MGFLDDANNTVWPEYYGAGCDVACVTTRVADAMWTGQQNVASLFLGEWLATRVGVACMCPWSV